MATALTCDDTFRSTQELIRGLFVKMDDGSYAIRGIEVAGGTAIDCDQIEVGSEEMLRSAIVRVTGNEYALQLKPVT